MTAGRTRRHLPTFGRLRLSLATIVISVGGAVALAALGQPGFAGALLAIGLLVTLPLIWVLGPQFPLVAGPDDATTHDAPNPVRTLRDRYARGEIDREELDARLDTLLGTEEYEDLVDGTADPVTAHK